jgi:hypothetical protein
LILQSRESLSRAVEKLLGGNIAACSPADVHELTVSAKVDNSKIIYKRFLENEKYMVHKWKLTSNVTGI